MFITNLDPEFAAENVGYFTSPYATRAKLGKPVIDRASRSVHVAVPNGVTRTARHFGSQGCITLPVGKTALEFKPVLVKSRLPDPATQVWPMGDRLPDERLPSQIDAVKLRHAIDAAFDTPDAMTAAFVVTWKGRLIGERYGEGITSRTPLEGWSMAKSLTATLMGILIKDGVYDLWQPAPIPEWQSLGDPRSRIRIADVLRMSSGLRFQLRGDPAAAVAAEHGRPLQEHRSRAHQLPNPARRGKTRRGLSFFSPTCVVRCRGRSHDGAGDRPVRKLPGAGYDLASARDWARLGNLYLQDGVWNGRRLLPEGYAKFVSTLAPTWVADTRAVYGAFFWINGDGALPVPRDAYMMLGAGGQTTLIVPSHDLVVVRMGHFKGPAAGASSFGRALALLMQAVPN